jgi:hypothetical protein
MTQQQHGVIERLDTDVVADLHALRVRGDRAFRAQHGRKMTLSDVIRRLIREKAE